jgi:hypothetical protein
VRTLAVFLGTMEKHVALRIHRGLHSDEAEDTKRPLETFVDLGNLERGRPDSV